MMNATLLLALSMLWALAVCPIHASEAPIEDRLAIQDLLTRYARAVDSRDWDLYRTVFSNDAVIDYRNAGGIKGNVEEVVEWLTGVLGSNEEGGGMFTFQQHSVSNIEVSFQDSHHATLRAIFYNPMAIRGLPLSFSVGGWYNHELEKQADANGEWKSRLMWEDVAYNNFLISVVGQLLGIIFVSYKACGVCFRLIMLPRNKEGDKTKGD